MRSAGTNKTISCWSLIQDQPKLYGKHLPEKMLQLTIQTTMVPLQANGSADTPLDM